jgi:integrase
MCALRFTDRVRREGAKSVLKIERSIFVNDNGKLEEKDTKTHQQRRVVLEPKTTLYSTNRKRRRDSALRTQASSLIPTASSTLPSLMDRFPNTQTRSASAFARLARHLGIRSSLKNQRHYNATELINADNNIRATAGRLGHSGGGTTTLRVYTGWWSEAEQQTAGSTPVRMPRPKSSPAGVDKSVIAVPSSTDDALGPYQRIAADLRGAIDAGILAPGDPLPSENSLAARYEVAASTAHRAVALLAAAGLVTASLGKRATVAGGDNASITSVTMLRSPSA